MSPTSVYLFPNGMVMAFDERGQQMPDFQGPWAEVCAALHKAGWPYERISKPESFRPLSATADNPVNETGPNGARK